MPDDRLGPRGDRRDLGHRDGRGVRREHRVVPADPVQRPEDLLLDLERLEHRLDHDVGVGGRVQLTVVMRPKRRLDVDWLMRALGGELRQRRPDAVDAARRRGVSRSRSVTSQPAWAATCAMPEPINPAPMTANRPAMCVSFVRGLRCSGSP